jgi:hypothetical protein
MQLVIGKHNPLKIILVRTLVWMMLQVQIVFFFLEVSNIDSGNAITGDTILCTACEEDTIRANCNNIFCFFLSCPEISSDMTFSASSGWVRYCSLHKQVHFVFTFILQTAVNMYQVPFPKVLALSISKIRSSIADDRTK